jgi:hypothetical protein
MEEKQVYKHVNSKNNGIRRKKSLFLILILPKPRFKKSEMHGGLPREI